MKLGTNHVPPFLETGSMNENGEHTSNPLAGPADANGFIGHGGMARTRLLSLDSWEHGIGAMRASRPFNRGVPSCSGEE